MSNRNLALAAAATTALLAPLGGLYYLWKRPLPIINGHLRLRGLHQPVEVIRDKWGIPHIYAQNEDDLFFAQGFVHAQDRLWQMELNRRLPTGRLSEIVGAVAFDTDRWVRILGLGRAAEQDYACLSERDHGADPAQHVLGAYARGVNAFIETNPRKLPIEYTLLRITPEPWRPQDSLALAKMMTWGLDGNWDAELLRWAIVSKLGPERTAKLLGESIPLTNPVILNQTPLPGFERLFAELHAAQKFLGIAPQGMSNNWVVDGTKSVTGKPLLANDPHLPLTLPSLWYQVHLVCPSIQVSGASLPGSPCVVLGHNAEIAWGFTNSFADVQDLYVEKFNPDNPAEYEYQGQWEKAKIVREEIRVKGEAEPRVVSVTITRHGPIINALTGLLDATAAPQIALRWTGHEPSIAADAVYKLNRAHNWQQFQAALRDWAGPAQNMVYADRAGNIGYYLPGRIPIRKNGKGATPVPGWTDEYEWSGYIPFEELPHVYNPPEHYVASANNQVVGADYSHHLSLDTMNGYRAKRIVNLLNAKYRLSADDYARMQVDVYCEPAQDFVKLTRAFSNKIVEHPALVGRGLSAREALAAWDAWDLNLTADSMAGALYEVTLHYAMKRMFTPWLGEALTDAFIGVGFHPLLHPINSAYMDRAYVIALQILQNEEREWLVARDATSRDETGKRITSVDLLAAALADALRFLEMNLGQDKHKWQWGSLHRVTFSHALGAVKPLDRIFNRGPFPYGGDTSTVWQAAFVPQLPIPDQAGFSASWRQIMDVGDWDGSRGVLPTGQSGHPSSRHYADMIQPWLKGQFHPLLWTREKVEANVEGRLNLEP